MRAKRLLKTGLNRLSTSGASASIRSLLTETILSAWTEGADRRPTQDKLTPVVEWIESRAWDPESVNRDDWDFSDAKRVQLAPAQKVILEHILTPDEKGIFPYREIIWSQIKKSGKTTIAGLVGAWFADQVEAPNLVLCAANNFEQSAGRIFAAMGPTIYSITGSFPREAGSMPQVRLPNGTIIKAIPNNYAGEAGANYGLTLWSELWAYTLERSQRLFEELVPVPTRKNSMRWIETYAGFEDESKLLLDVFLRVFKDTSESELQPEAELIEELKDPVTGAQLPCYRRRDMGMFMFWDHERRMTWQLGERGDSYYAEQKAKERPATYIRLHENRWQKSEGTFIPEAWLVRSQRIDGPTWERMIVACDASKSGDNTALVGIRRYVEWIDVEGKQVMQVRYRTCFAQVWEIPKGEQINLRHTLGAALISLHSRKLIDGPVWYDPYQLHQLMLDLQEDNQIESEEFNQGGDRMLADTFLYQQYRDDKIDNYEEPLLLSNLRAAKAIEDKNQRIRLVKQTVAKGSALATYKIDAAVAQSMAVYKASLHPLPSPPPIMITMHSSQEALTGIKWGQNYR
jgi:hypothetical protein